MTTLNTTTSWNVGKASGACAACGAELLPDTPCWAALCDGGKVAVPLTAEESPAKGSKKADKEVAAPSPFVRVDFCEACWAAGKRPEQLQTLHGEPLQGRLSMFSFWKTVVPLPQQKKKLLVDDSVLVDVFARMDGKNEPQEIRFRFVLALILMRKRLLKYEGMEEPAKRDTPNAKLPEHEKAPEIWRMIPRGSETAVTVINPHLTAEQITEVSQQLSAILAEEV